MGELPGLEGLLRLYFQKESLTKWLFMHF